MNTALHIFLDTFRLIRSQAIFYICLALSCLAALIFLCIGFYDYGLSLFFGSVEIPCELLETDGEWRKTFYLSLFQWLGIDLWLGWGAIILGLISTAAIFPNYQKSTRIGVELSKPPHRWQLFTFRYLSGMLFVLVQVLLFVSIAWLAIGWRTGAWIFEVWLAVPFVLLAFSFVYIVQIFVGVWTRSTLAGLIAGLLVWGVSNTVGFSERQMGGFAVAVEQEVIEMNATDLSEQEQAFIADQQQSALSIQTAHRFLHGLYTISPKAKRTTDLCGRFLEKHAKGNAKLGMGLAGAILAGAPETYGQIFASENTEKKASNGQGSALWIIGTSLGFELVLFMIAGWIFVRRDF